MKIIIRIYILWLVYIMLSIERNALTFKEIKKITIKQIIILRSEYFLTYL